MQAASPPPGDDPGARLDPLAGVLVRAVPEHPADDGLFGPRSLVWRVHRDRSFALAGIRSLMVQALHPLAMAGVAQHSNWKQDPFGRLAATSGYVYTVTYGDTASAHRLAAQVRAIHERVRGVDGVTGMPYAASDPELLLWIHAAMVDSIVDVVRTYGRGLDDAQADAYIAQMVPFAEIVGVPRAMVPDSVAALRAYIDGQTLLQATPDAHDAMAVVLNPPGLPAGMGELWQDLGQVAVGSLPAWAREMYGWEAPPEEVTQREWVRQLLGVLDVGFEMQPGVLEARRRVDARMRA